MLTSIAAHVSRATLSRHSHIRIEAKRRALDEIAEHQRKRGRLVGDGRHCFTMVCLGPAAWPAIGPEACPI